MPYPNVTPLPTAPARISKPLVFDTDSSLFLNALPTFRTQTNTFSTYIFNAKPNMWNFGILDEVNPPLPPFKNTVVLPVVGQPPITLVSNLDNLFSDMQVYSNTLNPIGSWIDTVVAQRGALSTYPNKLNINALPTAPTSSQDRNTFNSTTNTFNSGYAGHIASMSDALNQINNDVYGDDAYGYITDTTISLSSDSGFITDNTYTN